MPGVPASALEAGAEALVIVAFFLTLGWLVVDLLLGSRVSDSLTRWGLSFVGVGLYAIALMSLHMATGGRILSNGWLTRGITVALFVALFARRRVLDRRRTEEDSSTPAGDRSTTRSRARRSIVAAIAVLCVGLVVWGYPVFRILPTPSEGDIGALHLGWATQLLNGEPSPSGFITGDIPNFYPWGYHAVLALLARFTPGERAVLALAPLQLLQVSGALLALFCLGKQATGKILPGVGTALLGGVAGGFGFVLLSRPDLVLDPRTDPLRYMGDLLFKRSYNASFYQLAPPFPRDLGFDLLLGALLLMMLALKRRSRRLLVLAGATLGAAGLTGAESMLVGVGVVVLLALFPMGFGRARAAASLLIPWLLVYSLWLVPQIVNYVRLGGYVNLTVVGPVTLPPAAILVAWGLITPLGIYGALRWVPRAREDPCARLFLAFLLSSGIALLGSATVPAVFGDAFTSLGRPHRYWPLFCAAVALYAGLGVAALLGRIWNHRLWLGAASMLLLILAVASPVAASLAEPRVTPGPRWLAAAIHGDEHSLWNLISPRVGDRCVIATPDWITQRAFAYSGYRLVFYDRKNAEPGNAARIRWRDIYSHITPESQRVRDNTILVRASVPIREWTSVARRYGVDLVVLARRASHAPVTREYPFAKGNDRPLGVVRLSDCGL